MISLSLNTVGFQFLIYLLNSHAKRLLLSQKSLSPTICYHTVLHLFGVAVSSHLSPRLRFLEACL